MTGTELPPRVHQCDRLPAEGVMVAYGEPLRGVRSEAWHLHLVRNATEDDLEENPVLEEVGETIWTVCAEIVHCPYCGSDLAHSADVQGAPGAVDEDDALFGAFTLFDQEQWSGRLR